MNSLIHSASRHSLRDLRAAKRAFSKRVLDRVRPAGFHAFAGAATSNPRLNVVGVGLAEKRTAGRATGILAVVFLVVRQFPRENIPAADLLPTTIDGIPVDVVQSGVLRAFGGPDPKARHRPAVPGCSIGFAHPGGKLMAGTFGALVKDSSGRYLLSNNHVIAHDNQLPPGSPIFQPGLLDGGDPANDQIARLARFVPLRLDAANRVDAALSARISATGLGRACCKSARPGHRRRRPLTNSCTSSAARPAIQLGGW